MELTMQCSLKMIYVSRQKDYVDGLDRQARQRFFQIFASFMHPVLKSCAHISEQ